MVKKILNKFPTVALSSTKQNKDILSIAKQCHEVLTNYGSKVLFDENLSKLNSSRLTSSSKKEILTKSNLLIAIGGDGTMLNCAREYGSHGVPVLGINLGSLGFLNDIAPKELTSDLIKVVEGDYLLDKRFFLKTLVEGRAKGKKKEFLALNEVVIHSGEIAQLIEFDLFINQSFVYRQKADGLIISSPTGSTAYALSGGGPILHPSVDSIVILPMQPLSLSSSPLIVSSDSEIKITLVKPSKKVHVSCDSHSNIFINHNDSVTITKSRSELNLIHPRDHDFFAACRNKLGWSTTFSDSLD